MNSLRNLSGLAKASTGAIIFFAFITFLGQFILKKMYLLTPYGFALLVGHAITVSLNDPEAEEPVPLALRAAVGYGIGIIFGIGVMLIHSMITSNLHLTVG